MTVTSLFDLRPAKKSSYKTFHFGVPAFHPPSPVYERQTNYSSVTRPLLSFMLKNISLYGHTVKPGGSTVFSEHPLGFCQIDDVCDITHKHGNCSYKGKNTVNDGNRAVIPKENGNKINS